MEFRHPAIAESAKKWEKSGVRDFSHAPHFSHAGAGSAGIGHPCRALPQRSPPVRFISPAALFCSIGLAAPRATGEIGIRWTPF
jgi:hypothetical protein